MFGPYKVERTRTGQEFVEMKSGTIVTKEEAGVGWVVGIGDLIYLREPK